MRRLVTGCALAILLAGPAAGAAGRSVRAGDLSVSVSQAPDPPRTGENRLDLTAGRPGR